MGEDEAPIGSPPGAVANRRHIQGGPSLVKRRVHDLLDRQGQLAPSTRYVQSMLLFVIAVNVVVVILETVQSIGGQWRGVFRVLELVSVGIFTVEYVLRLWSAPARPEYRHPLWGRLAFALKPMLVVDLLAILPFYLSVPNLDLRILRGLRLLRIFRVAKLARYANTLKTLQRVIRSEREALIATLAVLVLLVLVASSLMYFAEHDAQPKVFSSIPASMWWGIMTVTTVGYGDVFPITVFGKIVAAIIAVAGIGAFALPTAIVGAAFLREFQAGRAPRRCPHCGKAVE